MCPGRLTDTWRYTETLSTKRLNKKRKNKFLSAIFLFQALLIFTIFFVSICEVCAADVAFTWDANPEPEVTGYRIYYGQASGNYTNVFDAGNRTNCTITGLEAGATYYFVCTAYSATDESNFSAEVKYTVPGGALPSSVDSGGGGGCFIATAAYGSWLAPEVATLREFRDRSLLTNRPGQAFVAWYYRVSPPVAAFIAQHESLRTAVRWGLAPVVFAVKNPATAGLFLCVFLVAVLQARRVIRYPRNGV